MTAFHGCATGAAESEDQATRGLPDSDWSPAGAQNGEQPLPPTLSDLNEKPMRRLIRQLRCYFRTGSSLVQLLFIYRERAAHLHLLMECRKTRVVLMSSVLNELIRLFGSICGPSCSRNSSQAVPAEREAFFHSATRLLPDGP